jgi:hypothetical protein
VGLCANFNKSSRHQTQTKLGQSFKNVNIYH